MTFLEKFIKDPIVIEETLSPDWNVTKRIIEAKDRPIIFENINGKRLISNIYSKREYLLNIYGLKTSKDLFELLINAQRSPLPLEYSKDFLFRKISSLGDIPVIKYFPTDGGPYITSSIIVAQRNGIVNASYHRMMVIDDKRLAVRLVPRHLYRMWKDAVDHGEELRVAVLIGSTPDVAISASISVEFGKNELEIASYLHKKRTGSPLVAYNLRNIPVPVETEYLIIGRLTENLVEEGPFVDITRTPDIVRKQPEFVVDEIFSSENPIYHAILPGGYEHRLLMGLPREVSIYEHVSKVVPTVTDVKLTHGGCSWLHAVISIRKQHDGDGKNAILAAFTGHPSLKHVVVVDDDVDIHNPEEVEWAIATRFQADRDLIIIKHARGSTLDPSSKDGLMTKMGLDATKPLRHPGEFKNVFKEFMQQKR